MYFFIPRAINERVTSCLCACLALALWTAQTAVWSLQRLHKKSSERHISLFYLAKWTSQTFSNWSKYSLLLIAALMDERGPWLEEEIKKNMSHIGSTTTTTSSSEPSLTFFRCSSSPSEVYLQHFLRLPLCVVPCVTAGHLGTLQ